MGVPGNLKLAKSGWHDKGSSKFTNKRSTKRSQYSFKLSASDTGPSLIYYEEVTCMAT